MTVSVGISNNIGRDYHRLDTSVKRQQYVMSYYCGSHREPRSLPTKRYAIKSRLMRAVVIGEGKVVFGKMR